MNLGGASKRELSCANRRATRVNLFSAAPRFFLLNHLRFGAHRRRRRRILGNVHFADTLRATELVPIQFRADGERYNGIPSLLRTHAPEHWPGKQVMPRLQIRRGTRLRLVRGGVEHNPLKFPQVEVHTLHLLSEMLQQLRIRRLIGIVQIGDRLLHGDAKKLFPNSVCDRTREPGIIRTGHPDRELVPQHLGAFVHTAVLLYSTGLIPAPRNQLRMHRIARSHVLVGVIGWEFQRVRGDRVHLRHVWSEDLASHLFIQNSLGRFDGRLVVIELEGCAEERGHFVKIPLRPLRHGVVMALRACDIRTQKSRQRVGKIVERHAAVPQKITNRAGARNPALCGEKLINKSVPVRVGREPFFDPLLIHERRHALSEVILQTQHVPKPVEHLRIVAFGVEQIVNQPRPFGGTLIA